MKTYDHVFIGATKLYGATRWPQVGYGESSPTGKSYVITIQGTWVDERDAPAVLECVRELGCCGAEAVHPFVERQPSSADLRAKPAAIAEQVVTLAVETTTAITEEDNGKLESKRPERPERPPRIPHQTTVRSVARQRGAVRKPGSLKSEL